MAVEVLGDGTTIITGARDIAFGQFLARRSALDLWIKTGFQVNSSIRILKVCKEAYKLKGSKESVFEQMNEMKARGYDRCDRCGERMGLSARAEIVSNVEVLPGETHVTSIIHAECMREGDQIA